MYLVKKLLLMSIIAISSWYLYIPLRIKKNYTRSIEINYGPAEGS
jgi:hypothetical protein